VRAECRIENVLQFRPPDNNIKPFIDVTKKPPVVTERGRGAIAALHTRLLVCKANVLVPLGNIPLFALTNLTAITKRRGSVLPSTIAGLQHRKVIPTIHPSAALRMYNNRHFIAHDLKRIRRESEFPEIKLMKRVLLLTPAFDEIVRYIRWCRESDSVAFDIEVSKEEISHVSLATRPNHAICIPFFDHGTDYFTIQQETSIWQELAVLLEDSNTIKIGQNIIFDSTFVYRKFGIRVSPIDDTMIAEAIVYPDFPKGLDFITSVYCRGEPYYKDEGKKWYKDPFADHMQFRRYSAMDSAVLMEAFPALQKELKRTHNEETYEHQKRLIEPLTYIAERGIRMDIEGLAKERELNKERIATLTESLNTAVGFELNIQSPKQVKDYFYIRLGIKPYTKAGKPTVDEKALQRIANKGNKEASTIIELRHLKKLQGTYYEIDIDPDGRLRCSWNPVGTKQGRVSSSKTIFGSGGNFQNQPPIMKKFMLADPGYVMITMDLAQAENRVVAYIADEQQMIAAFEQGIDIHKQTGGLIYRKHPSDITNDERQMGKRSNHGLNYAMGPDEFALQNQMALKEAKYIVERYHTIYPGVRRWHMSIKDELSRGRTLINCFNRHRIFMGRWDYELFKEAYSFIPQSTVADKTNRDGLCYTYYDCTDRGIDLLNTVHDSILFQLPVTFPIDIVNTILDIRRNLMQPIKWKDKEFIIPIDVKIGFNALEGMEWKWQHLRDAGTYTLTEELKDFVGIGVFGGMNGSTS